MRTLSILLFLTMISLWGKDFFAPKSQLDVIVSGGSGPITNYPSKSVCESTTGEECFVTKDVEVKKFIDVEEDDTTKPIYSAKTKVSPCAGAADCYAVMGEDYCDTEPEGYRSYINEEYTEVYCSKITGFNKKIVIKLVEDEVKRTQRDQAVIDRQNDQEFRRAKKQEIGLTLLNDCVADLKNASTQLPDVKRCLLELLKHVKINEIDKAELQ